jgi:hypothetical protein
MPQCTAASACPDTAVVQWLRRPTPDELAQLVAAETDRRERWTADADPAALPQFGPLPAVDNTVQAVYACPAHAIPMEAAARVHDAHCPASYPAGGTYCPCEPPPAAEPEPPAPEPTVLDSGWTVHLPTTSPESA